MQDKKKFTFSGHDTFQCRQLWLKKGFDFIKAGKSFNNPEAVVDLGVGKNMVSSIRYWLKAFNIADSTDSITDFGEKIFNDKDGFDPYLEDEATLWLLHYQLVKNGIASTFNLIFNEFRREKIEFTKGNFVHYIKRKAEDIKEMTFNENTINDDFDVFIKSYRRKNVDAKEKEDPYSGVLTELNIIQSFDRNKEEYFYIENTDKDEIPDSVILYVILDSIGNSKSISLVSLEQDINSVGTIFALTRNGLFQRLENICAIKEYKITYKEDSNIKELQFQKEIDKFTVLKNYYSTANAN
jgi:Protein of unknown function (DUF4007)